MAVAFFKPRIVFGNDVQKSHVPRRANSYAPSAPPRSRLLLLSGREPYFRPNRAISIGATRRPCIRSGQSYSCRLGITRPAYPSGRSRIFDPPLLGDTNPITPPSTQPHLIDNLSTENAHLASFPKKPSIPPESSPSTPQRYSTPSNPSMSFRPGFCLGVLGLTKTDGR